MVFLPSFNTTKQNNPLPFLSPNPKYKANKSILTTAFTKFSEELEKGSIQSYQFFVPLAYECIRQSSYLLPRDDDNAFFKR